MIKEIYFETPGQQCWINLLDKINAAIFDSGVKEGICIVHNPHSTAGLFINSYLDPNTPKDILHEWDRLIPTRFDFFHQFDTPTDASGHVKSALMGISDTLIVKDSALLLGPSQGVIFAEFDGPRQRKLILKILSD